MFAPEEFSEAFQSSRTFRIEPIPAIHQVITQLVDFSCYRLTCSLNTTTKNTRQVLGKSFMDIASFHLGPRVDKMVRGITAATVVPTASDDRIEPSVSDEEEGVEYSSEEENSSIPGSTVAELESEKYLHAAFNGHVNDPTPTAPSNKAITTGVQVNLQQSNPKSLQQKSVAPLVGKTLRQRSQSAVMQKQNGVELTKNYLELVRDFQQLQPFTRRPDGKYPTDTRCVYCVDAKPTSVFFPCQHMCVCNDCIQLNNISTDYSSTTDWCACPVCMTDIRLILPHSGKEEEKYWKWVLEVKPNLPTQFKQEFKDAGKRLTKNTAPRRGRRSSIVTMLRRDPTPQQEAPKNPPPKPKVPVLGRRHSWQPGEVANVQNVAASNEHEEAHNCSIL